ncbi:RNA-binding domain-containing protein [Polychaeton citri CBS 116435]|uniref:RNA-binding domain-containing protein n=1 Tax=Polychaeton citri CBS 116435 TaxID=1314669 RepID=A0A9P4QCS3_9PEZI|nr:RNA-binding domain-containing protein [Polychaeton citri CBS 116435]
MADSPGTPPNATVYVKNLEEKIKIPELIAGLRPLFEEFGTIVEIIAKKNFRAKGQAFIVFDNVESAQEAIELLNGFEVFGKPMQLAFAKARSDATVKREGGDGALEEHKKRRLAIKERRQAADAAAAAKAVNLKRPAPASDPTAADAGAATDPRAPNALKPPTAGASASTSNIPDELLPPNKIIFLRDLPEDYGRDMLSTIFSRFPLFKEVRTVPGRSGIAFVEYETEGGAVAAREATNGMVLGGNAIRVTFQRT